jgi:hypothetical protein
MNGVTRIAKEQARVLYDAICMHLTSLCNNKQTPMYVSE